MKTARTAVHLFLGAFLSLASIQVILADFSIDQARRDALSYDENPTSSVDQFRKWADEGNAVAQLQLGYIYLQGFDGVKEDAQTGVDWLKKSANQGNIEAMNQLGATYFTGMGNVKKDIHAGVEWWLKAARKGDLNSLNYAARMLGEENMTKEDHDRSIQLFREGVKKGSPESMYCLAVAYLKGIGVAKDENKAEALFDGAGELGYSPENQGGYLGVDVYPIHDENYYRTISMKKYQDLAKKDDSQAIYQLGLLYGIGAGGSPQETKAIELIQKAAKVGHVDAMLDLYNRYQTGEGVPESQVEANKWLQKAAEAGNDYAQKTLAIHFLIGNEGFDQSIEDAVKWFGKSADQGDAASQYQYGISLISGDGIAANKVEGLKWIRKAANQGYAPALEFLEKQ